MERQAAFHSNIEVNLDGMDEKELYDTMVERRLEKMATYQSRGSGWRLHSIIQLDMYTVEYDPMRATKHIPLPKKLGKKKILLL